MDSAETSPRLGRMEGVKALSLTQPWATAVAIGLKQWETRSWCPSYRGPLAIHAAKAFPASAKRFAEVERTLGRIPTRLPFGGIIAICELVEVKPTWEVVPGISAIEKLYGDYSDGRFAFKLVNVQLLPEPIPARGSLGLWEWNGSPKESRASE